MGAPYGYDQWISFNDFNVFRDFNIGRSTTACHQSSTSLNYLRTTVSDHFQRWVDSANCGLHVLQMEQPNLILGMR